MKGGVYRMLTDQRGEPIPRLHRAGYAGQRKVIRGGKQFHQAAD